MPKYELAICVVNELDDAGGVRKKEGDLVAVRPHPWNWGAKEIDQYLIVIIETVKSFKKLDSLIRQSVYRDLVTAGNPLVKQSIYNSLTEPDIVTGQPQRPYNDFEIAHKNRFQISHAKVKAKLSDLNLTKVRNKVLRYQPFKNRNQLVQKFNGMNGNRLIIENECDCDANHADNNNEFSINLDNIAAVILDKISGNLVKP